MPHLSPVQEQAIDGLVACVQRRHPRATFLHVEPDPEVPEAALVVHMIAPGDEALHLELMHAAGVYAVDSLVNHGLLLSLQLQRPDWCDLR